MGRFDHIIATIPTKYECLKGAFTERTRRLWAAAEAEALGHDGIAAVARATGLARELVAQGMPVSRNVVARAPHAKKQVGNGANQGREGRPQGQPVTVNTRMISPIRRKARRGLMAGTMSGPIAAG